jgi:predicted oxidoreductase
MAIIFPVFLLADNIINQTMTITNFQPIWLDHLYIIDGRSSDYLERG